VHQRDGHGAADSENRSGTVGAAEYTWICAALLVPSLGALGGSPDKPRHDGIAGDG